uniref:Uncharacterized protein n=1 Tax=Arundo donax TaxID=35708 RepID=A0A0A9DG94_ARUDO
MRLPLMTGQGIITRRHALQRQQTLCEVRRLLIKFHMQPVETSSLQKHIVLSMRLLSSETRLQRPS